MYNQGADQSIAAFVFYGTETTTSHITVSYVRLEPVLFEAASFGQQWNRQDGLTAFKGFDMEIKAIETQYMDRRFRSRLEARWAVFFQEVGANWDYEPEGFVMSDGTTYLPDFVIKHPTPKPIFSWIEIKPNIELTETDQHKVMSFCYGKQEPIVILRGEPYDYFSSHLLGQFEQRALMPDMTLARMMVAPGAFITPSYVELLMFTGVIAPDMALRIMQMDQEDYETTGFVEIMEHLIRADLAAKKAHAARFEFGEKG